MPFLKLPGVDLWYEDTGGSGTPVILLHAASGTCDSWVYQLPAFTAAGYRCISYERRGWGRSVRNDTGAQPGYLSEDLHGLVEHLGLDRCHLVATAAGGITALDYTLEHPERVNRLAVANTIGGMQDPDYLEVQHRLRPPEIATLPIHLRELGPSYRGEDPEGVQRWIDIELATFQEGVPEGTHGTPQTPRHPITYARLETIQQPTLVLVGAADILSPPAMMRLLAEHIPNSRYETVLEAGHAAFWERPKEWNKLVLEFLG